MSQDSAEPYVANITLYVSLNSIADVMGTRGVQLVLAQAGLSHYQEQWPPDDFRQEVPCHVLTRIYQVIEEIYGSRGVRGFMARDGEGIFLHLLKTAPESFEPLRQQLDPTLSLPARLRQAVQVLSLTSEAFLGAPATITEDNETLYWSVPYTHQSWGRQSSTPICWSFRAALMHALVWLLDGLPVHVQEVKCRACGDEHCSFQISLRTD